MSKFLFIQADDFDGHIFLMPEKGNIWGLEKNMIKRALQGTLESKVDFTKAIVILGWENFIISERKKNLAYSGLYGNTYF